MTMAKTYKEHLSAEGDYALYLDNQRTVMTVNLQTGDAAKIDGTPGYYEDLQTDGRYVIYREKASNQVYVFDTETKEEKMVGEGRSASIADGTVAYFNSLRDIMLYDARTGKSRVLWKMKEKQSMESFYVDTPQIAFNGKYVVWMQTIGDGYQTRILDVTEADSLPKVLNIFKEMPKGIPMVPIAVGPTFAAWQASDNGKDQVVAADLASRQTGVVADGGVQLIGMSGERLVLKDKANSVVIRSLQSTGKGNVVTDKLVSALPDLPGDKVPALVSASMGGNQPTSVMKLAAPDNSVIISTDNPNPYENDQVTVTIAYKYDIDLMLTKALIPGQKFVSHPWVVGIGEPTTPFHLSMSYMAERAPAGEEGKLGVYSLEDGRWVYRGGLLDPNTKRLHLNIDGAGIYAVLCYDVPNTSIRDYWQSKAIKDYNENKPIRVFLDGKEVAFHEQPVLKDGSTTVEFRPIFEKLGLQIDWDDATRTVTGTKQGQLLKLTLGQSAAAVNGSSSELPAPPFLNHGYTFVLLRFVGEATGRKVLWDPNLKAVYIYDQATEGKLYYDNGVLMYEGQLKDGIMNGKGKLYRQDGSLWYDAEFRDNQVTGWGTIYYSGYMDKVDRTGDVGIGQFKNGLPDGFIVDISSIGQMQFEGQEVQGVPNGKVKFYVKGILLYDGELKYGQYNGFGKYYRDGKLDYEGYWAHGKPNGHGKEYKPDGTVFREGEFVDGKFVS